MLQVYLWKEWHELRWALLMSAAVLLIVPAGLAWAIPNSRITGAPWFAIATFVAAVVLSNELVGGEARRGQLDAIARLPGALRAALLAKLVWLFAGIVGFGALGYAAEAVIALVRTRGGVPWVPGTMAVVLWAVALAGWVVATSCWWPKRSALPTVLFLVAACTAPLVIFGVGRVGLYPIPLDVAPTSAYLAAAGLVLCWIGFRGPLGRPRERAPITRYLATFALAFAPVWAMGAWHVWRWHAVDPSSAYLLDVLVSTDHRRAYVHLSSEVIHGRGNVDYSVVVDLETGDWEQVGPPMSVWGYLQPVAPAGRETPALIRAEMSPDGQELLRTEIVDTRSGAVTAAAEKYAFDSLPEPLIVDEARARSPYRTASGDRFFVARDRAWIESPGGDRRSVPWERGDYPLYPAGRGFRVANRPRGASPPRYFDLERLQLFELDPDPLPIIRRGAWVATTYVRGEPRKRPLRLFDPETRAFAPLRGLGAGEVLGPMVDATRFVAYRDVDHDAQPCLLDPETGERTPLRVPATPGYVLRRISATLGTWNSLCTPSGAPIVRLHFGGEHTCYAKIVNGELVCTTPSPRGYQEIVTCPDDDTVLVVVGLRTLERLRFGSATRELLFPR